MSTEKLVDALREMEQFYGRVVVDGKFVSEPTRTGKLFGEAIVAIAELRAENERLKEEVIHLRAARQELANLNVAGKKIGDWQQLEQQNAELRYKLKLCAQAFLAYMNCPQGFDGEQLRAQLEALKAALNVQG